MPILLKYYDVRILPFGPVDIAVELPAKFELAMNPMTAKTLGLTIQKPALLRADEAFR